MGAFPIRSKVFSKIVPHFDTQDLRQYLHQIMATFSTTGKDVVMVVDRSGNPRRHCVDTSADASRLCSVIVNPAISTSRLRGCGDSLWRLPRVVACCTAIFQTQSASPRIYVNEIMPGFAPVSTRHSVPL